MHRPAWFKKAAALMVSVAIVASILAFASPTTGNPISGTISLEDADTKYIGEAAEDRAGMAVADAGDVNGDGFDDVLIGAPRNDSGEASAGAAYIVFGPADPGDVELSDANVKLSGEDTLDFAGFSVSTAGDVNGDGYDDVIVGAPFNDERAPNAGAAYVIYGGESLPSEISLADADSVLYGNDTGVRVGWDVSDVNDSTTENSVLVGSPAASVNDEDAGAAYLVAADTLSDTVILDEEADAILVGEDSGDRAGWSVSTAGDFDEDGTEDVIIGAPHHDASEAEDAHSGAAYVVSSSVSGTNSLADATAKFTGAADGDQAGYSVSDAGDLNDDAVDDVVVGAPYNDTAGAGAGAAYVVYGASGFSGESGLEDADLRLYGENASDHAGWAVSSAGSGDVTCDEVDDLLVGAPHNNTAGEDAGAAYVISGDASLEGDVNLSDAHAKLVGEEEGDEAGRALSEAGDLDTDGFDDVIVGAPFNDAKKETDSGAAYVLFSDCGEADGVGYGYGYGYGYK